MKQYHDLLRDVLDNGRNKEDRTGTGTRSVFGRQIRFDLTAGFPLLTTKKIHWKSVVAELIWFLSGDTNSRTLEDQGVTIWSEWKRPWFYDRGFSTVSVREPARPSQKRLSSAHASPGYTKGTVKDKLRSTWAKMFDRCYNVRAHNYKHYGEKGVTVCERWEDVEAFVSDVQMIPHWEYKRDDWTGYELDKDYYGSNQYGPDTCIWLPKEENVHSEYILITNPEGVTKVYEGLRAASNACGISQTSIHRFVTEGLPAILKGNNVTARGWAFQKYVPHSNTRIRRRLINRGDLGPIYGKQWRGFSVNGEPGVDQISELINNLRANPFSRRHVVIAWNPADLPFMALAPCHCLFQCNVDPLTPKEREPYMFGTAPVGRLSLRMDQRSADAFLGVPYNIASYALLTHMLAQQCNMLVGDLIIHFGDLHLYQNHIHPDIVFSQLAREPMPLPQLALNRKESIFDYTLADCKLVGYNPWPAIKAPIAV